MKFSTSIYALVAAALVAGCSSSPHWTLKGQLQAGEPADVVIESLTFNGWMPADTVTTSSSGNFTYKGEPKGYPDIYRIVTPDGSTAYFPVDSTETVTLDQTANGWRITGSSSAEIITRADSMINASIAANGAQLTLNDSILKRNLTRIFLADPGSIGAYYIVNKRIDGKPLFDPNRRSDLRMIGAVANAYQATRPGTPRAKELYNYFMQGRRTTSNSLPTDTIVAQEIGHYDMTLYDNKGKQVSLSDVVDNNRLTLLNFTVYAADESPAFNIMLNDLYKRYKASGLEIYQVSVDVDETVWRRGASSIPWISVYNSPVNGGENLQNYNVVSLPTVFLIGQNGEIIERITDVEQLTDAVRRNI